MMTTLLVGKNRKNTRGINKECFIKKEKTNSNSKYFCVTGSDRKSGRENLKVGIWHELETYGTFDKKIKFTFISDEMSHRMRCRQ